MQAMLYTSLHLREKPRNAFAPTDLTGGMKQVLFVHGFDPGVHKVSGQD